MDTNSDRKPVLVRCRVIDEESRVSVATHYSIDRPEPLWLLVPVGKDDQFVEVCLNDEVVTSFIIESELRRDRSEELKEVMKSEKNYADPEYDDDLLIEGEAVDYETV